MASAFIHAAAPFAGGADGEMDAIKSLLTPSTSSPLQLQRASDMVEKAVAKDGLCNYRYLAAMGLTQQGKLVIECSRKIISAKAKENAHIAATSELLAAVTAEHGPADDAAWSDERIEAAVSRLWLLSSCCHWCLMCCYCIPLRLETWPCRGLGA